MSRLSLRPMQIACLIIGSAMLTIQANSATAQEFNLAEPSQSDEILIIEPSDSGRSIYAYSSSKGRWDKLTANPHPVNGLVPLNTASFAVVRGDQQLHGFSLAKGRWTSINTDGEPSPVVVSSRIAASTAGTFLYGFSPKSGQWSNIDVKAVIEPARLEVGRGYIRYRDGSRVFVFSTAADKWASVDLAVD